MVKLVSVKQGPKTTVAICSQVFNGFACIVLGVFFMTLHDEALKTTKGWPVMMMFSAVDSFFWGVVYLVLACCHGDFSLTIGTLLGMCVGPLAIIIGLVINSIMSYLEVGDGYPTTYGYALMIFGVLVFFANVLASVQYRNTAYFGGNMDKIRPLAEEGN